MKPQGEKQEEMPSVWLSREKLLRDCIALATTTKDGNYMSPRSQDTEYVPREWLEKLQGQYDFRGRTIQGMEQAGVEMFNECETKLKTMQNRLEKAEAALRAVQGVLESEKWKALVQDAFHAACKIQSFKDGNSELADGVSFFDTMRGHRHGLFEINVLHQDLLAAVSPVVKEPEYPRSGAQ